MGIIRSVIILAMFMSGVCFAKIESTESIIIGNKFTINSNVLNEKREILVYLPSDFNRQKKYPVIYLLDGEHFFTQTVGILESLTSTKKIPESILVGVKTTVRVRDYLPPILREPKSPMQGWIKKKFPGFGGANEFTRFLTSELFPFVEKKYLTNPNRALIGYSNAGVFGLHLLVNSPDLFTNYLLISPAGWHSGTEIDNNLSTLGNSEKSNAKNLYLSVASEGGAMLSNALRVASNLETNAPKTLNWKFNHFDSKSHQTTVFPSIHAGLTNLFKDFFYPVNDETGQYGMVKDIQEYYLALSERYGYSIPIPESVFSALADKQFENNRVEEAMVTLDLFVQDYPESSFAHSSLGSGYMRIGEMEKAKSAFEHALTIVIKNGVTDYSVIDFLNDMIKMASKN